MYIPRLAAVVIALLLSLTAPVLAQAPPGATCMNCEAELAVTYWVSQHGGWYCSKECGEEHYAKAEKAGAEEGVKRQAEAAAARKVEYEAAREAKAKRQRITMAVIALPLLALAVAYGIGHARGGSSPKPSSGPIGFQGPRPQRP